MFKKTFVVIALVLSNFFFLQASAATRTIMISSSGSERSFCNANSGSFCLDSIKRRAQDNAATQVQRDCEFNHRGRALRYTLSYSTFCNPATLPPRHDGVWVSCNSTAYIQCELN